MDLGVNRGKEVPQQNTHAHPLLTILGVGFHLISSVVVCGRGKRVFPIPCSIWSCRLRCGQDFGMLGLLLSIFHMVSQVVDVQQKHLQLLLDAGRFGERLGEVLHGLKFQVAVG